MSRLTHLSLFTGIGGLDLAAEAAGIETVGQCEFADYPTKVLEKHWPDVPRWRDIRTLTGESFYERTGIRTVDIISGGLPCQPFSVAGKQRGKADDRFLWPEMLRVIREIRPTWIVGENVAGIVNLALDEVLSDLEREGYAGGAYIIPAHAAGAWHRRNRVAIVGYAEHHGQLAAAVGGIVAEDAGKGAEGQEQTVKPAGTGRAGSDETMGDAEGVGLQGERTAGDAITQEVPGQTLFKRTGDAGRDSAIKSRLDGVVDGLSYWLDGYLKYEPDIPRTAAGSRNRANRIKCLGNAVVPQAWYPIFKAIVDTESEVE